MTTKTLLGLLACISAARAWMPWDHELQAFNATARLANDSSVDKRALPTFNKVRGVNLGAWLISEPFFMGSEWTSTMGCGSASNEWDCMLAYGSNTAGANNAFLNHYNSWITPDSVQAMHDSGLNTIRIPIGFWSNKNLVNSNEYYPDGDNQLGALDAVISKAHDLQMYVIMDLHGAPGAQVNNSFTGRYVYPPEFFIPNSGNYERAYQWLTWMTNRIHNTPTYQGTVGMIEVLNEPLSDHDPTGQTQDERDSLTQTYYPNALKAVRDAENALGISTGDQLTVQFMDNLWGSGDPTSSLPSDRGSVAFDDHQYYFFNVVSGTPSQYDLLHYTCTVPRTSDNLTPKIVGEFALIVGDVYPDSAFNADNNHAFYTHWFSAQQYMYEQTTGWIFWTWKTAIDYRWTYSYGTYLGIIPNTAAGLDTSVNSNPCSGYT